MPVFLELGVGGLASAETMHRIGLLNINLITYVLQKTAEKWRDFGAEEMAIKSISTGRWFNGNCLCKKCQARAPIGTCVTCKTDWIGYTP